MPRRFGPFARRICDSYKVTWFGYEDDPYPSSDDFDYWAEHDAEVESFQSHYADEIEDQAMPMN